MGPATRVLLVSWGAVLVVYLLGELRAEDALVRLARRRLALTDSPEVDLERLGAISVDQVAREATSDDERSSVVLPLLGAATLVPLTAHLLASEWIVRGHTHSQRVEWLLLSMLPHLLLVVWARGVAGTLRPQPDARPGASEADERGPFAARVAACLLVSAVALRSAGPSIVACTGILSVQCAFAVLRSRVLAERLALE
jgi:hypothetical protein